MDMLERKDAKKKDSWSQTESSTVVSTNDLRWLQDAPKMNKIDSEIETYNYWARLTKPVEETEKQVRFAGEAKEPKISTNARFQITKKEEK